MRYGLVCNSAVGFTSEVPGSVLLLCAWRSRMGPNIWSKGAIEAVHFSDDAPQSPKHRVRIGLVPLRTKHGHAS